MYLRMLQLITLTLIASPVLADAATRPAIVDAISRLGLTQTVDSVGPAPFAGFVEVVAGTRILYVSTDGDTVIDGEVFSLDRGVNLTERARAASRLDMLATVPLDERIVVRPTGRMQYRLLVFTDTECPHCRKLHEHLGEYLHAGIEVEFFFYPRAGHDSEAFQRAVAVWCAADRETALAAALEGARGPAATCTNPVARHYDLAVRLGLRGTPALIAEDGSVMYGYVAPGELIERLDALRTAGLIAAGVQGERLPEAAPKTTER